MNGPKIIHKRFLKIHTRFDCGGTSNHDQNPCCYRDRSNDHVESEASSFPPPNDVFPCVHSAVVGSTIVFTSETRLAGNPPWAACSRTIASFGAR